MTLRVGKKEKNHKRYQSARKMLLLSAMALGLVETTSPNGAAAVSDSVLSFSGGGVGLISVSTAAGDNDTFRTGPGDWSIEQCLSWRRPHHLYFQLANAFFFLAILAPHGAYGMLWLRCMLIVGFILMGMWGWLIECTGDVVLWSGIFLVGNAIYLIVLLCRVRPVRFDKEIEAVRKNKSLYNPSDYF